MTTPTKTGNKFLINTFTDHYQNGPTSASFADGGYVVAWHSGTSIERTQDGDGGGVYGQRYNADNSKNGTEFRINTNVEYNQSGVSIATFSDGGFIATWSSFNRHETINGLEHSYDIFGQRYNADGSPNGSEFRLNTELNGDQSRSSVTVLADDTYLVTWNSTLNQVTNTLGLRFAQDGAPLGIEFRINPSSQIDGRDSLVTNLSNSNGDDLGFVITWNSREDNSTDIYGQRYNTDGTTNGEVFSVNTSSRSLYIPHSITELDDGGFVMVWEAPSQGPDSDGDIHGRRYAVDGTPVGPEFIITDANLAQRGPSVITLNDGGYLVAWSSKLAYAGGWVIDAQRFDVNGLKVSDQFRVDTPNIYSQSLPAIEALHDDRFVITWDDFGSQDGREVYGQVYTYTPVLGNNNAPSITSSSAHSADENTTEVTTIEAGDPDGQAVTFAVTGGDDQGKFQIDYYTGALSFRDAPNFEIPTDAQETNVYEVEVTAQDGNGGTDTQVVSVTVLDISPEFLTGTPGDDDPLNGDSSDEFIYGLAGDDVISGNEGDDTVSGGEGEDYIYGNAGDDILSGDADRDHIYGGTGNDTLHGNSGDDRLDGGYGSDVYHFEDGWGDDRIANYANSSQDDANKIDIIEFGTGILAENMVIKSIGGNHLSLSPLNSGDRVIVLQYYDGEDYEIDQIVFADGTVWDTAAIQQRVNRGSDANDYLIGRSTDDTLEGFDGDDTMHGNDGNDTLLGGAGNDTMLGHYGNDTLYGGTGSDTINGGHGNDTLVGNASPETLTADILNGGSGDDTFYAERSDTILGDTGHDVLYQVNDYAWTIDLGATSIEYIRSGFNGDTIDAATQTSAVEVYSGGGNDVITGSDYDDFLFSGVGDDIVNAGAGNDVILGDAGADSLSGGIGNDSVYIDAMDTLFDGGFGRDALYIGGDTGLTVDMAATSFEWLRGSTVGGDTVDASDHNLFVNVYASGGDDMVTGSNFSDYLWGEDGDDTLVGNAGDDVLVGGLGADTMTGSTGFDVLYANAGSGADGAVDTFVMTADWGTDILFDFENGTDKIDMSALGTSFDALTITADGAHAHIALGSNLISVANSAGLIDAGDFLF